jgi:protein TonB
MNTLYLPYGAYELKATYQRNLIIAVIIMTLLLVSAMMVVSEVVTDDQQPPNKTEEGKDDGKGITIFDTVTYIIKKETTVDVAKPKGMSGETGIPTPVPDDEIPAENENITLQEEIDEPYFYGEVSDVSRGGSVGGKGSGFVHNDIPKPTSFIPLEIYPEIIYKHTPEYPRLAKQAGITGTVWINVLLDEEGNVIDAIIAKSSGIKSLDEAALKAAYKNKFKPGIQNGRPVKVWVTYLVEFKLD